MKSIIKDIFYGNNTCFESMKMPESYFKKYDIFYNLLEEFKTTLNKEQNEMLNKILDANSDVDLESSEIYYKEGFKFGLLIGVECSENNND